MKILIPVVIVIIALVVGLYFYSKSSVEEAQQPEQQDTLKTIEAVSTSDTTEVIESELQDTIVEDLDKEFANIDLELEKALSGLE